MATRLSGPIARTYRFQTQLYSVLQAFIEHLLNDIHWAMPWTLSASSDNRKGFLEEVMPQMSLEGWSEMMEQRGQWSKKREEHVQRHGGTAFANALKICLWLHVHLSLWASFYHLQHEACSTCLCSALLTLNFISNDGTVHWKVMLLTSIQWHGSTKLHLPLGPYFVKQPKNFCIYTEN